MALGGGGDGLSREVDGGIQIRRIVLALVPRLQDEAEIGLVPCSRGIGFAGSDCGGERMGRLAQKSRVVSLFEPGE